MHKESFSLSEIELDKGEGRIGIVITITGILSIA